MSPKMQALKEDFIKNVTNYMKLGGAEDEADPDYDPGFDAGYTQAEIDRSAKIIDTYLASLANAANVSAARKEDSIMAAVKAAVLDFNKLNAECEQPIIETDQREMLCELIISAALEAGLEPEEYDITEQWREW
jgi:hypothetical protein